jgi:hypothetical protein
MYDRYADVMKTEKVGAIRGVTDDHTVPAKEAGVVTHSIRFLTI